MKKCDDCKKEKNDVYEHIIIEQTQTPAFKLCGECFAKKDLEECAECGNYTYKKDGKHDEDYQYYCLSCQENLDM